MPSSNQADDPTVAGDANDPEFIRDYAAGEAYRAVLAVGGTQAAALAARDAVLATPATEVL